MTAIGGKGVEGNRVMITEGIAPGDVIAVAGVSFLRDGQEVKLMSEQAAQQENAPEVPSWQVTDDNEEPEVK
jgi:hypothetical protein